MAITYKEKGRWLHDEIRNRGHMLHQVNGEWQASDDAAVQEIIDTFDPMPYAIAERVGFVKREAVKRANNVYSFFDPTTPASLDMYEIISDILDVIAPGSRQSLPQRLLQLRDIVNAVSAAETALKSMTTLEEVHSFNPSTDVAWPDGV